MTRIRLFDSHCHLDFVGEELAKDDVIERGRDSGVTDMLVPGVMPTEWPALDLLRAKHRGVHIAVGIHPQYLRKMTADEIADGLTKLTVAAKTMGAVAIGECGVDGATASAANGIALAEQLRILDAHLDVATALDLPVVLHVLKTHGAVLAHFEKRGPFTAGGVVHSYSGSAELVDQYVRLNLHISFAGSVTRPDAKKPLDAIRAVPEDRLLIETDSPDQSPHGIAPGTNEPSYLPHILRAVAEARGMDEDAVAELTYANACALFRVTPD